MTIYIAFQLKVHIFRHVPYALYHGTYIFRIKYYFFQNIFPNEHIKQYDLSYYHCNYAAIALILRRRRSQRIIRTCLFVHISLFRLPSYTLHTIIIVYRDRKAGLVNQITLFGSRVFT
jgi:hypothetical protein